MTEQILQFIFQHWRAVLAVWLLSSMIGAMPTPNGGKVTGSWWYKWLFGTLHTAAGNIPRVLATLFPKVVSSFVKRVFGINVPEE